MDVQGEPLVGFTDKAFRKVVQGIGAPKQIAKALHAMDLLVVTPSEAARYQFAKKIYRKKHQLYAVRENAISEACF